MVVLITIYGLILLLGVKGKIKPLQDIFNNNPDVLKYATIIGFSIFLFILIIFVVPSYQNEKEEQKKETTTAVEQLPKEEQNSSEEVIEQPLDDGKTKIEDKLKKKEEVADELAPSPMTDEEKHRADIVSDAEQNIIDSSLMSDPSKKYFTDEIPLFPLESYQDHNLYTDEPIERQMSYGKGIWKNQMSYFIKEQVANYREGQIKIYPADLVTVKPIELEDVRPTLVKYYEVIQTGMEGDRPLLVKKLIRLQLNVPTDTKIIDMDLDNKNIQDTNNTNIKNESKKKLDENYNEIKGDKNE